MSIFRYMKSLNLQTFCSVAGQCSTRSSSYRITETLKSLNYYHTRSTIYYHVKSYSNDAKLTSPLPTEKASLEVDIKKKSLQGGVTISDLVVGSGSPAKSGKTVTVYYSGRLKSTNEQFDAMTSGSGLTFRLGRGEVIEGWDVGLVGMKVGGKRVVTCPPNMAYGTRGFPPKIPPKSTLIFEVELKAVE